MRRVLVWSVIGLSTVVAGLVLIGLVYRPDPGPLLLARRTLDIDGTQLSYHQSGNGRDVVLLHGGMGSAEDFIPVIDELAREFRVTAIDRPGFGLSRARGDDPTYPGNGRRVEGVIRSLGLERPILVGHSHGGGVALQIAQEFPGLPAALVLLAPAWKPGAPGRVLDHLLATPLIGEGLAATIGRVMAPQMIAAVLKRMIGPDTSRVPADFVSYRQQLWNNPRSLAVQGRQQVTDNDGLAAISAGLAKVRVRSLILACDGDSNEGNGLDSRRLANELPGAELWWLQDCGHYPQFGKPEKVVEAVRRMAGAG
jgi:pimeloyl-ACP methyl ester carboxylesterase